MQDAELRQDGAEAAAVLREVDRVDRRPEQAHAGALEPSGYPERRLSAELDDHALGLLELHYFEHVLDRQRLEVEAVGRVVVGRDRLRIAVHHHGVSPELTRGHGGVDAAVVELDPLADPVRSGAEDHDARA